MGNHYHVLLRTRQANLSSLMHFIGTSYASRLREQGNLSHIFSGRYKSIRVETEQQALFLSRYVHLNPRKAGIVEHPGEYPWSSCMSYLLDRGQFDWVNKSFVLGMLSPSPAAARKRYSDFLMDPCKAGHRYPGFPDNVPLAKAIFGGDRFVGEAMSAEERSGVRSIEILYRQTCEIYGKDCLAGGRVSSISAARPRLLFIFAARECLLATTGETGQMLNGLSPSSITRYHKEAADLLREGNSESASLRRDLELVMQAVWP